MKRILTFLLLCTSAMCLFADNLSEAEYYQRKAEEGYRREAAYYEQKAKGYEREAEYYIKKAEGYQREAAYYTKRGDVDRANTQTRYAQDTDEKAVMYLRRATQ